MSQVPAPPPAVAGGKPTARAERTVTAPLAAVRGEILRVLRTQNFQVGTEQLTLVEASRGGGLAGAGTQPDKLPVAVTARFNADGASCTVSLVMYDSGPSAVGRALGNSGAYGAVFLDLFALIDTALRNLDGAAEFAEPRYAGTTPAPPSSAGRIGSQLVDRANRALDGTPKAPIRQSNGAAWITSPRGTAVIDVPSLQMMLTVGTMIVARPGSMPANLARQVAEFVALLEARIGGVGPVRLEIGEELAPVVEFLRTQARIREKVALRTLQVCTTCRLEKVVNPDFQRLQNRNRKIKVLGGSVGGLITPHGISPFVLVGRLVQLKQLDPDFVCQRCQGLTADSSVITFCPNCGERRVEPVLRTCQRCKHDFRRDLTAETLWHEIAVPEPTPAPVPVAPPVAPPSPPPRPVAPPVSVAPPMLAAPPAPPAPAVPAAWPAGPAAWAPGPAAAAAAAPAWRAPDPARRDTTREHPVIPRGAGAGWHPDPARRHELRWWDGMSWTAHVITSGAGGVDPV